MKNVYKQEINNILYSNAWQGIQNIQQDKATPLQWLNMLKNNGSLKKEEDKWLGLSEYLEKSKKKSMGKNEILAYIEQNKVKVEEYIIPSENKLTKAYSIQELENKKEIVFSISNIEEWEVDDDIHYGKLTNGKAIAWTRIGDICQNGEKILIIDELQSKRHQLRRNKNSNIPDAPFGNHWYELVMKRLMQYAAKYNYQKIAWTKGKLQKERYEIGMDYDNIIYVKDNLQHIFPGKLIIQPHKSVPTVHSIENEQNMIDIIGLVFSKRILAGEYVLENVKAAEQGIEKFYDHVLLNFMKMYCKRWNSSVKEDYIANYPLYTVEITPSMRKSVLKGQAMFKSEINNETSQKAESISKGYVEQLIMDFDQVLTTHVQISDRANLPSHLTRQMNANSRYPGCYDPLTNTVYLLVDEIKSTDEIENVIKHEVLGHKGLRSFTKEKLYDFLDQVYPIIPDIDKIKYLKKYNDKYIATEEYIADQAEKYTSPTQLEKIISIFRDFIRKLGFKINFSDTDIKYILYKGRNELKKQNNLVKIFPGKNSKQERLWVACISSKIPENIIDKIILPMGKKLHGMLHSNNKRQIVFTKKSEAEAFRHKTEMFFSGKVKRQRM